jgi:type II secretory pathway pseudopilin PulG
MFKIKKRLSQKHLLRDSKGTTFVEVVIAIVVLGLITASVIPTLLIINKAEFRRNEQKVAESLVRNQIEYIKSAPYVYGNETNPEPEYLLVPVPDGSYEIELLVQPVTIDPETQEHEALPAGQDEGIQEITVRIHHVDKMVLEAKNYKVDRP